MKLLKIVVISYAVKTLLIGAAWLAIPDLPQRAAAAARQTWAWMSSSAQAPVAPASARIAAPPGLERPADASR